MLGKVDISQTHSLEIRLCKYELIWQFYINDVKSVNTLTCLQRL